MKKILIIVSSLIFSCQSENKSVNEVIASNNIDLIKLKREEINNKQQEIYKKLNLIDNNNEDVFLKALIVVPKKRVRLASDRNVIKRRVKEAYRLQKSELEKYLKSNNHQLNLAIIYQKHEILDYKLIEVKIKLLLSRLKEEL